MADGVTGRANGFPRSRKTDGIHGIVRRETELRVLAIFQITHTETHRYSINRSVNDEMDESAPPRAKQAKRSVPLSRLTAEERAKQFPENLYAVMVGYFFVVFVSTVLILLAWTPSRIT